MFSSLLWVFYMCIIGKLRTCINYILPSITYKILTGISSKKLRKETISGTAFKYVYFEKKE